MVQYCKTTFSDSAIFNENNVVENRGGPRFDFAMVVPVTTTPSTSTCVGLLTLQQITSPSIP